MADLLMLTKVRKNKNDDDNESDNNKSDKICAEDDVDLFNFFLPSQP